MGSKSKKAAASSNVAANAAPASAEDKQKVRQDSSLLFHEECNLVKDHLLKCESVSTTSPAVKSCLQSLDQLKTTAATVPSSSRPSSKHFVAATSIIRTIILDIPLMLLFGLYLSSELLILLENRYFLPQIKLMEWTDERRNSIELTYYDRHCGLSDVTANSSEALLLPHNVTPSEAERHMLRHGVQIYPQLLQTSTAQAVREYILDRNPKEDGFGVIENKGRFSFGINVNADPSIVQALHEIANHPTLRPALERIVGKNPAVIEFTGITSVYGAGPQHFHQDVVPSGSAFKYARNFLPSYSLFIPLQDISTGMGPTEVCPGTHVCQDSLSDLCTSTAGVRLAKGDQVWKRGYGALVNQQLLHRGTEHQMEGGPERVLFILTFAPRPRFGKNQVETRMIGHSGSYSIKWNQWGHTLSDFGAAKTEMMEPFKTARSLGLYAPSVDAWGWDLVTTASMRIANADAMYTKDDLEEFVTEKEGIWWLPVFLKEPLEDEDGWSEWIVRQTVKIQEFLRDAYKYAFGGYAALMTLMHFVVWLLPSIGSRNVLGRAVVRLMITHGIMALAVYLVLNRVENGQWAKNIKYGKAYVGVYKAGKPRAFGTIPFVTDVLKSDRYSSPYLTSYNKMLDATHPGNQVWADVTSHHANGFSKLSTPIQRDLCANLVHLTKLLEYGRMLTQNEEGNWAEMSGKEAVRACHKDMMMLDHTNDIASRIIVHLDYMISETRHGVWRDQAIHKVHMRDFLIKLQDKVMGLPPPKVSVLRKSVAGFNTNLTASNTTIRVKFLAVPPPPSRAIIEPFEHRLPVPEPLPQMEPPYAGAWIKEGDIVDGQYQGSYNEWYRGRVVSASSNKGNIDVLYDDGELDPGLCRMCVRPHAPYTVDEAISARNHEDTFFGGRIVKVNTNANTTTYDVQTTTNGLMKNVSTANIMRSYSTLTLGARVEAKFQGVGEEWYLARIVAVHDDGSFDVEYDDGDREFEVEPEHIRLAA
jgi:hypothetical protein